LRSTKRGRRESVNEGNPDSVSAFLKSHPIAQFILSGSYRRDGQNRSQVEENGSDQVGFRVGADTSADERSQSRHHNSSNQQSILQSNSFSSAFRLLPFRTDGPAGSCGRPRRRAISPGFPVRLVFWQHAFESPADKHARAIVIGGISGERYGRNLPGSFHPFSFLRSIPSSIGTDVSHQQVCVPLAENRLSGPPAVDSQHLTLLPHRVSMAVTRSRDLLHHQLPECAARRVLWKKPAGSPLPSRSAGVAFSLTSAESAGAEGRVTVKVALTSSRLSTFDGAGHAVGPDVSQWKKA